MRFFILFCLIFLGLPAFAKKAQRKPAAGQSPAKVITFACRETPDSPPLAIGIVHLRIDLRDPMAASFGMNLYVQTDKNSFSNKAFSGMAAAVPQGYMMRINNGTEPFTLHLHPAERTLLPLLSGHPLNCEPTAEVQSR